MLRLFVLKPELVFTVQYHPRSTCHDSQLPGSLTNRLEIVIFAFFARLTRHKHMEKPIKSVLICLIGLSTNLLSVLYIINVDMSLRRILCTRNCCYPCSALNSQKDLRRIITAEHKQELELTLSGVCRDTVLITIVKIRL